MGYFLILAIILLGGALATLGDRVGSRVGKARLSLFNLRPKKTAVLITILTGSLISASTMGILLATSRQFRDAVFRIGEIQQQLQEKRTQQQQLVQERNQVRREKEQSEDELAIARAELTESIRRLRTVNRTLRTALKQQQRSAEQLRQLQTRFRQDQAQLQQAKGQAAELRAKIARLLAEEQQLQTERQRLLAQRNQTQTRLRQVEAEQRDLQTAIAEAKSQLQVAQAQQKQFETAVVEARSQLQQANQQQAALLQQRTQLQQEVLALERNRQRLERGIEVLLLGLRQGKIAIRAGQVLASGVVEGLNTREAALQALDVLLRQARTNAIVLTNPPRLTPDSQVIQITRDSVNQLAQQLSDGQAHFVRILAAANYLEGEDAVLVFPQYRPNRLVFDPNTVIATVALTPSTLSDEKILEQLEKLFQAANQQAIQAGVLADPVSGTVGSFRQVELFRFVFALKERNDTTPVTIQAVTTDPVFTSGPLGLKLVARQGADIIVLKIPNGLTPVKLE